MTEKKSFLIVLLSIFISLCIFSSTAGYLIYCNYERGKFDEEFSDIKTINIDSTATNLYLSNYKTVKLRGYNRTPEVIKIYKDSTDNEVEYEQIANDLANYKVKIKTNERGDIIYSTESGPPSFEEMTLQVKIDGNKFVVETNTDYDGWVYLDADNDYVASVQSLGSDVTSMFFTDGVSELIIDDSEQLNLFRVNQVKIDSRLQEFFSYKSLKPAKEFEVN